MKKLFTFLFIALMLGAVYSCKESSSYNTTETNYNTSTNNNTEQEKPKDAEKKSTLFYQRMLELFCQRYYSDCFSGREYLHNSLVVDDMTVCGVHEEDDRIVSYDMKVTGVHSFKGYVAKTYNNSHFEAIVEDLGENTYKITFFKIHYDVFGEAGKDTATRTMTYSE